MLDRKKLVLGVHYASDILAGWGMTLAFVAIVYALFYGIRTPAFSRPLERDEIEPAAR